MGKPALLAASVNHPEETSAHPEDHPCRAARSGDEPSTSGEKKQTRSQRGCLGERGEEMNSGSGCRTFLEAVASEDKGSLLNREQVPLHPPGIQGRRPRGRASTGDCGGQRGSEPRGGWRVRPRPPRRSTLLCKYRLHGYGVAGTMLGARRGKQVSLCREELPLQWAKRCHRQQKQHESICPRDRARMQ